MPLFGFGWHQKDSVAKQNQTILQLLFSLSIHGYEIFSPLFGSVWQQNHSDAKQNQTILSLLFSWPINGYENSSFVWHQNGSVAKQNQTKPFNLGKNILNSPNYTQ
jgi:hypothetical protein